jgi:hypothetical protein
MSSQKIDMKKSSTDILREVVENFAPFLDMQNILRLSEVSKEFHAMCLDRGFEATILQYQRIQRSTFVRPKNVPIKSVLGLFKESSITCKAYMGRQDTYMMSCTPCIFTMHWDGGTFTASCLNPFRYHNTTYENIFFPWHVLLSWDKEALRNHETYILRINLIPNVYINTTQKVDTICILLPKSLSSYHLSERILNRCCMMELLQSGGLGVQRV